MQGQMVPVILLPRFTSFAGLGVYETAPLEVTEYDRMVVVLGRNVVAIDAATVTFQDSHDGVEWFDLHTESGVGTVDVTLTRRWFRLTIELENDASYVTYWCAGQLRRRVG